MYEEVCGRVAQVEWEIWKVFRRYYRRDEVLIDGGRRLRSDENSMN